VVSSSTLGLQIKRWKYLWDGMAFKYQEGVDQVASMNLTWNKMSNYIDGRFIEVQILWVFNIKEAKWWQDACTLFSNNSQEIALREKPTQTLNYFQSQNFHFTWEIIKSTFKI
jgi:alpha-glucuronidase